MIWCKKNRSKKRALLSQFFFKFSKRDFECVIPDNSCSVKKKEK